MIDDYGREIFLTSPGTGPTRYSAPSGPVWMSVTIPKFVPNRISSPSVVKSSSAVLSATVSLRRSSSNWNLVRPPLSRNR